MTVPDPVLRPPCSVLVAVIVCGLISIAGSGTALWMMVSESAEAANVDSCCIEYRENAFGAMAMRTRGLGCDRWHTAIVGCNDPLDAGQQ